MSWRDDPRWRLVGWDEPFLREPPADAPPTGAELSTDGYWASLYDGRRVVATWIRTGVVPPSETPATIAVSEP